MVKKLLSAINVFSSDDSSKELETQTDEQNSGLQTEETTAETNDVEQSKGPEMTYEEIEELDGKDVPLISSSHQDVVAPALIQQTDDATRIQVGTKEIRTLFLNEWNESPETQFLSEAIDGKDIVNDVSIHISPYDSEKALKRLEKDMKDAEQVKNTESESILAIGEKQRDYRHTKQIYEKVQNGEELYEVSLYITIRADDEEELNSATDKMVSELRVNPANSDPKIAMMDQLEALQSVNPLGNDELDFSKDMLGSGVATLYPFTSTSFVEKDGIDFGIHRSNGSPVIINRWARGDGYNQLTFGKVGAGKSFSSKMEILREYAASNDTRIVMLDPLDGFKQVNMALGGEEIVVGGSLGLNPLELVSDSDSDENQINIYKQSKKKAMEFFELFFKMQDTPISDIDNGKETLQIALDIAYENAGIDPKDPDTFTNEPPTITEVNTLLKNIAENPSEYMDFESEAMEDIRETSAAKLQGTLRQITDVKGEYYNLSKQTNDSLDFASNDANKVHYINMKTREDSDKRGVMMQLLLARVYDMAKRVDDNVMVYIDEAHLLVQDERSANYLETVIRHSRHENLGINFITQHIEDFFENDTGKSIAKLCTIIKILYTESAIDSPEIKNTLDLNNSHVNFIQQAQIGDGENSSEALIKIGQRGYVPALLVASEMEMDIID